MGSPMPVLTPAFEVATMRTVEPGPGNAPPSPSAGRTSSLYRKLLTTTVTVSEAARGTPQAAPSTSGPPAARTSQWTACSSTGTRAHARCPRRASWTPISRWARASSTAIGCRVGGGVRADLEARPHGARAGRWTPDRARAETLRRELRSPVPQPAAHVFIHSLVRFWA